MCVCFQMKLVLHFNKIYGNLFRISACLKLPVTASRANLSAASELPNSSTIPFTQLLQAGEFCLYATAIRTHPRKRVQRVSGVQQDKKHGGCCAGTSPLSTFNWPIYTGKDAATIEFVLHDSAGSDIAQILRSWLFLYLIRCTKNIRETENSTNYGKCWN